MDLDAIVIGGGQAGLAAAWHLKEAGLRFLVLERGRVGEAWRSQRWDSFRLNTPSWMNELPGAPYEGDDPGRYVGCRELVALFESYVERFDLPVRTGANVTRVTPHPDGPGFAVTWTEGGAPSRSSARHVVVAAGIQSVPRVPAFAEDLPARIARLHIADYRNADALPDGAVVVVGGGQSGTQIAEDLAEAGRTVHLCTSRVGRLPRRYRGRDILEWAVPMRYFEMRREDVPDPAMIHAPQPMTSGVGGYGHTLSLQRLARQGVRLLGRAVAVEGEILRVDDSLRDNVRFADEKSAEILGVIDRFLEQQGIDAPPREPDPDDEPDPHLGENAPTHLDLRAAGVGTVLFATGFTGDFSWIDAPVTDADGRPLHENGASPVPGISFLGFPWLTRRASGLVHGVGADAARIVERIAADAA